MLERLTKMLKEFGYEYSEVETEYNTKIEISRSVTIIMCDNGMIIKNGEDYCIANSPWEVIDVLDCIMC